MATATQGVLLLRGHAWRVGGQILGLDYSSSVMACRIGTGTLCADYRVVAEMGTWGLMGAPWHGKPAKMFTIRHHPTSWHINTTKVHTTASLRSYDLSITKTKVPRTHRSKLQTPSLNVLYSPVQNKP